jgi:cytochrome P450
MSMQRNSHMLLNASCCIHMCCRHPDFWPRPFEFLPERWLPSNIKALGPQHPDAFVPFSAGSRSCIGRYFAMLEMQVGHTGLTYA